MYGHGGDPSVGTAHGPMTKLCPSDTIFACLFIYLFDVYDMTDSQPLSTGRRAPGSYFLSGVWEH